MAELIVPSPALLAANQKLLQLRANRQAPPAARVVAAEPERVASTAVPHPLPAHLGWDSPAVTAVLRKRGSEPPAAGSQPQITDHGQQAAAHSQPPPAEIPNPTSEIPNPTSAWVKLYPDIGLGMLRQGQAAAGRLWLLCRYVDQAGSGALRIDSLKNQLTQTDSPLHVCTWRQLRNLLRRGEGVFWRRERAQLWLCSAARVAHALGVPRLTGRPVALPKVALLDGIGAFRAHLYAAFHSGRAKETRHGDQVMPIARETLTQLSGVGRSSQRNYEARVGIDVQANFAVGDVLTKENQETCAWAKGQALFELKDYRGQQGKKGKMYLAWQLPNSYGGQHRHRPRGRQRRINRKLKGLVMKGMPGNVGETSGTQKPEKRYYPNGKLAAQAYGRNPAHEVYWQRQRVRNGRCLLWQEMS